MIVAESFLPHMNGVTNSVLRTINHLVPKGHEVQVIAPQYEGDSDHYSEVPAEVIALPAVPLPKYPEVRVALGGIRNLITLMRDFNPDVVHLASPFVLGWRAVLAAEALGIPVVAVYQTKVPSYAERYGIPGIEALLWQHVLALHQKADVTLAPSKDSIAQLESLGVPNLKLWQRGVDTERFSPSKRDSRFRKLFSPNSEKVIGYVGRLAAEKQVEDLKVLADIPGTRLAIVGEGPLKERLETMLPNAVFTGFLGGEELAKALASFDLFVHPGENETFCQTIQEAMASGVPVVATGAGGPLDLVTNSQTGWLYQPGNLDELRSRAADLIGDDAKRRAFAQSARESVLGRSWQVVGDQLIEHYQQVIVEKARRR